MALLLLSFMVHVAGAIYIEGQEIPDDGQMHILAAEETAGLGAVPGGMTILSMPSMPAFATGGLNSLFSQGFPARVAVPPAMPGALKGIPAINTPALNAGGDIVVGGVIGHAVPPTPPGYWDNIQNKDLHTNMPMIPA
jgi:hypothetical protein